MRLENAIQKARSAAREASRFQRTKRVRKAAGKAEKRATRLLTKHLQSMQLSFAEWSKELEVCHADYARLKQQAGKECNKSDMVLEFDLSLASYKRVLVTLLRNTAEVEEGCAALGGLCSAMQSASVE